MRRSKLFLTSIVLCASLLQAQQPRPPAQPDSLRFAVIGDTGTGGKAQYEIGQRLTAFRLTFPFEFVLMLGDNIYGGESAKDFRNKFEKPYEMLLASGIEFYASLGNHDLPERQTSYKLFNMGGARHYTFKPKAGIRFFSLDSNYMDRKQLEWFESELKSSGSEWKVCFFHHPLYSSGEKHGPSLDLRSVLEPLMVKYGVDVVLTGHEHFYERLKPQKGIQHFIVGSSAKLRKNGIQDIGITAEGFDDDNVFMVAEIAGDEMSFRVVSRTGQLIDSGKFQRAERKAAPAN